MGLKTAVRALIDKTGRHQLIHGKLGAIDADVDDGRRPARGAGARGWRLLVTHRELAREGTHMPTAPEPRT